MAAARTRDTTYLGARYRRLVPRLGKKKAIVAVEHSILTAAWHMLTDDVDYHDLGGGHCHVGECRRPAGAAGVEAEPCCVARPRPWKNLAVSVPPEYSRFR